MFCYLPISFYLQNNQQWLQQTRTLNRTFPQHCSMQFQDDTISLFPSLTATEIIKGWSRRNSLCCLITPFVPFSAREHRSVTSVHFLFYLTIELNSHWSPFCATRSCWSGDLSPILYSAYLYSRSASTPIPKVWVEQMSIPSALRVELILKINAQWTIHDKLSCQARPQGSKLMQVTERAQVIHEVEGAEEIERLFPHEPLHVHIMVVNHHL